MLTPRPGLADRWAGTFAVTTTADGGQTGIRLEVGWESIVTECSDGFEGGWQATRTIQRAVLDLAGETEGFPIPADSADELVGFSYVTDYKDYGSWLFEGTPELRQISDDSYALYLELDRNFKFVMPTMPSEVVGVGATWTYSFDNEIARGRGIDMHFEAVAIEGTTYDLRFEIDGVAGITGSGQVRGDITLPLPTDFEARYSVAEVPGVTVVLEMTQTP